MAPSRFHALEVVLVGDFGFVDVKGLEDHAVARRLRSQPSVVVMGVAIAALDVSASRDADHPVGWLLAGMKRAFFGERLGRMSLCAFPQKKQQHA